MSCAIEIGPSPPSSSMHHNDNTAAIKNSVDATSSSLVNVSFSTPTHVSINVATPTSTPSSLVIKSYSVIDACLLTHYNFPLESPQHPPHSSMKYRQGLNELGVSFHSSQLPLLPHVPTASSRQGGYKNAHSAQLPHPHSCP
ncbi:hypothetical protein BDQ17DRAFT_889650 [Cyathus striatus]|nr:hypothetical protein BDQ17DRAFT_889650 [Cyathus striatus]